MNSFKSVRAFQIELEFGGVGFWGEEKTGVPGQKPLGEKERTNNKLNPHGVDAGIWTRATLVGGECSHHCATLAPNKIVICCNVTGLKLKLCVNSFQTFPRLICLQQHYYSVKSKLKLCQGRLLATYVNRKWTPWFLGQWFCLMFWKYCLYKSKDT